VTGVAPLLSPAPAVGVVVATSERGELPVAAAARLARMSSTGAVTSLLSVPSALGARSAGFDPVGDVMGAVSARIGWRGSGLLDYTTMRPHPGTVTSGSGRGSGGFGPYVRAVYRSYDVAVDRMTAEATALRADGVVGVSIEVTEDEAGGRHVVARGSAVRARGRTSAERVFLADLSGIEVSALLRGGWIPVTMVWGVSVGVRPTDWTAAQQMRWSAGTAEVTGYTDLVTAVRADAREQLNRRVRTAGADGVIVSGNVLLEHSDVRVEATIRGTAIARFSSSESRQESRTVPVLPLGPVRRRS